MTNQGIALEFSDLDLGDKRLNKRLISIAEALSKNPGESICAAIGGFHDCKAAYRLFANKKISPNLITQSHINGTFRRAMKCEDALLILHDTTDLVYERYKSIKGLSSLTTKPGMTQGLQGMKLHNSLMLTESGVPLGIIRQTYFNYEDYLNDRGQIKRNIKGVNKLYPIEQKASWRWINHMITTESKCKHLEQKIIHVADRESDIYEFLQISSQLSINYVIRARGERRVHLGKKSSRDTTNITRSFVDAQKLGEVIVEAKDESDRSIKHTMAVKVLEVMLHPPQRNQESVVVGKLEPTQVRVVEARSVSNPNFYWRIFTNLDCLDLDQAIRVLNIYKNRWAIESYHRVLKSGFKVEHARLNSRSRLENFCALASILAWRIMWLYLVSRNENSILCEEIFSNREIQVIMLCKYSQNREIKDLTAYEAVIIVARLGGFLNRRSDGPPGMISLWKGWKALYERIEFLEEMTYG